MFRARARRAGAPRGRWAGRLRCAAAACAAAGVLTAAPGAQAAEPFSHDCGETPFECTRVEVPLDRSGGVPGTVPLYVERARGPGRRSGRGAIFALAGGPGQGATTLSENFNQDLFGVLGRRDLIIFDQRGTGRSAALNCPELEGASGDPLDVRAEACANRLGPRRSFYTTRDSVEDLEAVRRRIGVDRITLFGVSYGTKVAVAYALRYPQRVERLVLDSVVPPEGQDPFDRDTFAALPRVLREVCRRECAGVTSDLARDVATLAQRLRAGPLRGSFVDRSGRPRTVEISARALYEQLRSGDLDAALRAEYPGAVRSAIEGDPAPLLRLEHRFDFLADSGPDPVPQPEVLSFSLFTATVCEEAPLPWERTASPDERLRQARTHAAAVPDAAFLPFDRETALASDNNSLLLQCLRWPARPDPPALAPGPLPDVPVLVLEGREDLRTPLQVGRRVAARFPRAQVAAVPKTAHAVLGRGAPCAATIVERFFAGRALGSPCARARRSERVRARVPARLGQVAPAPGVAGSRGRTLAAVALTLTDLRREHAMLALAQNRPRAGGLRGGRFEERAGAIRLRALSFVPGVTVSGSLRGGERRAGRLRIAGSAGERGTLVLSRDGTLSGRLGGRAVRTRVALSWSG